MSCHPSNWCRISGGAAIRHMCSPTVDFTCTCMYLLFKRCGELNFPNRECCWFVEFGGVTIVSQAFISCLGSENSKLNCVGFTANDPEEWWLVWLLFSLERSNQRIIFLCYTSTPTWLLSPSQRLPDSIKSRAQNRSYWIHPTTVHFGIDALARRWRLAVMKINTKIRWGFFYSNIFQLFLDEFEYPKTQVRNTGNKVYMPNDKMATNICYALLKFRFAF